MSIRKRILIISDLGPANDFAGGLVMKDIIRVLQAHREIDLLLFNAYPDQYSFNLPMSSILKIYDKPGERYPSINQKLISKIFGILYEKLVTQKWMKKAYKVVQFEVDSKKYDEIFFFLQGQYLPRLAADLDLSNIKVFTQYWDPIEWHAKNYNLPKYTHEKLTRAYIKFESTNDVNILVPSTGMKSAVTERSAINPNHVHVVYPPAQVEEFVGEVPDEIKKLIDRPDKLIVYAGGLYAVKAIEVLIESLELINFELDDTKINFLIISSEAEAIDTRLPNVVIFKRLSSSLVNLILSHADLAVLPYPFDSPTLTTQAFPSKFPTYAKHTKNLLVIAPETSSLMTFSRENKLSIGTVTSLSRSSIASEIRHIFSNNNDTIQSLTIKEIYKMYFTWEKFENQIKNIFQIKNNSVTERQDSSIHSVTPSKSGISEFNRFARLMKQWVKIMRRIIAFRGIPKRIMVHMISRRMAANTRNEVQN